MEAYPIEYVEHNLPLVLLSGLGKNDPSLAGPALTRQEYGAGVQIESPECKTDQAQALLREAKSLDGHNLPWNSASLPGPTGSIRFRVKTIGRTYTLPARKAAPIPQSPGVEGVPSAKNTELHSPLSPLSPSSPVFPDGIFTARWYTKHQQQVPSIFLAFFDLNANEAAQDEQIKNDINAVKGALSRSGFKTRFAAILISDRSILHAPELEDRVASVRRATALDLKTGLFFMPPMSSQVEIATFVQDMMKALQPSCVEYYRDLTKHARRKKARGGPPPLANTPVGGASQSTATSGWNVRYEVKQGVFAEFRQEMDVAERHYSAAIEELFSSEGGVFETTASWSPRWDEARLLCDSIALRTIRCQLWNGNHTGAVQSWQNYKQRTKDLIDRRGKGTNSYGWDAWEARWASIMSQLVDRAQIWGFQKATQNDSGEWSEVQVYAQPEKAIATAERLPPWNLLHHSGYWLRLLAKGIKSRWEKADAIPEEDRVPPGQSPASAVANRWKTYDVYMVPEPHQEKPVSGESAYDHPAELGAACIRAAEAFEARRQIRMAEQLKLELAEDFVGAGRHSDALQVLTSLWETCSWREDEWFRPFSRLLRLLSDCASRDKTTSNAALMPALTWELLSIAPSDLPEGSVSFSQCLDLWEVETPINLKFEGKQRLCPVMVSFAFRSLESHVGEPQECQLSLEYRTSKASEPLVIDRVELAVGSKTIVIRHDAQKSTINGAAVLRRLSTLREGEDGSSGTTTDLSLAPMTRKYFEFSILLREAQLWQINAVTIFVQTPNFSISHSVRDDNIRTSRSWMLGTDGKLDDLLLAHMDAKSINVLPKPPKVKLQLNGLRNHCYTDELVRLRLQLINEEAEAMSGSMTAKAIGPAGEVLAFTWSNNDTGDDVLYLAEIAANAASSAELAIQAPPEASTFTLTIDLRYTLISDPGTPLTKSVTAELVFVAPFETKFTFQPRLHDDPWPSYFDPSGESTKAAPDGVVQLWKLGAQVASLAELSIKLHKLELLVHEIESDALCNILPSINSDEKDVGPGGKLMAPFELTTQKYSLDDRRPSHLDLSLVIEWSFETNSSRATTEIAVPRLTIPTSEPRVLCTARPDRSSAETLHVQYHLENPSTHFLTFALTMEASEEFAFSGAKYRTLSLAPLSRNHVDYQLILHQDIEPDTDGNEGLWVVPNLQVVDSYYQKNLRVHPAGPNVKLDEKRDVCVWFGKAEAK
ncbi:Trafficking protein particle complex subunit 11 [Pseudocercospora fuligena]|uniref:Trafficking protein particle complex subunit 11 n=1 Tax=Pseudocercospora fuligena TaxID=685502 RepID=A0A8H6VCC5_9PEZI|nr:Trafficking protein particle complex subunit 11 [Pseudocercospora fuligena]